jgi:hypothetical protein
MSAGIIVTAREPVDIENYTSGQEFFLYMLTRILPRYGIHVKVMDINELVESCKRYSCDFMHLYYLGFKDVVRLRKLYRDTKMIYHVYHVEDVSWTKTHELSWKAFLLSMQLLVYAYLATSKSVHMWLKSKAFLAGSVLVEPYYRCSCEVFHSHGYLDVVHEKFHGHEIGMLYVGRLNPYRSPPHMLLQVAKGVGKKTKKAVRLVIVTKSKNLPKSKTFKCNNLTVDIINGRICDEEKCELYRKSQFFIYLTPWGNVAMNPPITILEAVYHGVIPLVSETISKDLKIPSVFMANNVKEAVDKIALLYGELEKAFQGIVTLKRMFEGFYDEDRFVNAFKCLV